uniref:Proteasome assembly chaperone 4 n=1 Tax=Oryzias sinensis TaxID=183150 RepID=A0A8C7XZH1_9TELE
MNGADFRGISVHNFSEKILEQVVHFHVMKLDGGFFLWVGSAPVLSNLAVSLNSKYDSMPLSTLVMGDPSETTASSLAQRLGSWCSSSGLYSSAGVSCAAPAPVLIKHGCAFRLTQELNASPLSLCITSERHKNKGVKRPHWGEGKLCRQQDESQA